MGKYPGGPQDAVLPSEAGILVDVFVLYRDGIRLGVDERKAVAPVRGRLVIDTEMRPSTTGPGYVVHIAELNAPVAPGIMFQPKVLTPMFDPVIVKATVAGIFVRGRQISIKDGERIEYSQMWKVLPVFDSPG
jgi:hypothetical protein